VERVLEDVVRGHRGVAEAVHEQRLQFSLQKVKCDGDARQGLQGGGRGAGVLVDIGAQEVEQWVDEEGAEVFDYEDGAPGYLGAWWVVSVCAGAGRRKGIVYPGLSPVSDRRLTGRRCLWSFSCRSVWVCHHS